MKTINLYIQPKMEQKCQAHNLKVVGSNPTPAPNNHYPVPSWSRVLCFRPRLRFGVELQV